MSERGQGSGGEFDASKSAVLSASRFCLALIVMAYHLSGSIAPQSGLVAVEAFFGISGFLVTMIATGAYAGRPKAFLANRFLRIYPLYWACLLVSLAIILHHPGGRALNPFWVLPAAPRQILANVLVFGLTQDTPSRLLPPAWSLHTELWFYLIIGLGTATRPRLTVICALISVIISACCVLHILPIPFYGHPIGNAYAFFLGSLAWQFRRKISLPAPAILLAVLTCLFAILALGPQIRGDTANIFVAPFITPVLLISLLQARPSLPTLLHGHFNFLGKISYPMFLLHWPVAMLFWSILKIGIGPALFVVSSLATIVLATAIHFAVEQQLDYVRDAIRLRRNGPGKPSLDRA